MVIAYQILETWNSRHALFTPGPEHHVVDILDILKILRRTMDEIRFSGASQTSRSHCLFSCIHCPYRIHGCRTKVWYPRHIDGRAPPTLPAATNVTFYHKPGSKGLNQSQTRPGKLRSTRDPSGG